MDYVMNLVGPERWKVKEVHPDRTTHMAVGDMLTFGGTGGGNPTNDFLRRKHVGTLFDWGHSCRHIRTPIEKVTLTNSSLGPYHILYIPASGTDKAKVVCGEGGGPSGAVWTAEDQT